MSIEKALKILNEYQSWRLGGIPTFPYQPRDVTVALNRVLGCFIEPTLSDEALEIIEYRKRMNYDQFSMSTFSELASQNSARLRMEKLK